MGARFREIVSSAERTAKYKMVIERHGQKKMPGTSR